MPENVRVLSREDVGVLLGKVRLFLSGESWGILVFFFPKEEMALPRLKFKKLLIPTCFWWLTKVHVWPSPHYHKSWYVPCHTNLRAFHVWTKKFEYMNISRYWMCTHWNKKMRTIIMGYLHLIAEVWIWRYLFIIINHQIKSKKVKRNMESNITKSLLKKFWKRWVTLPLNSSYGLPFWCSLSLMTPPPPLLWGPSPPLPKKKI